MRIQRALSWWIAGLCGAGCTHTGDEVEVSAHSEEIRSLSVEPVRVRPDEEQAGVLLDKYYMYSGCNALTVDPEAEDCCQEAGCAITHETMTDVECPGGHHPIKTSCDCGSGTVSDGVSFDEYWSGSLNDDLKYLECMEAN